jgi:hypothetical protein
MGIFNDTIYIMWVFITVVFFINETKNHYQMKNIAKINSKQLFKKQFSSD